MNQKQSNTPKLKKKRSFVCGMVFVLTLALAVSALAVPALASGNAQKKTVNAELTLAYGGSNSIATMTFDDGLPETSLALNELMKEYGFKATLALVSSYYVTYDANGNPNGTKGDVQLFKDLFNEGYLAPMSHSREHRNLAISASNPLTMDQVNQYRYTEVDGSLTDLNYAFPEQDVLVYGVPSSWCESVVFENIRSNFYASRGGYCVLTVSPGQMQSLNPATDNSVGGWYQPYSVRMMPESYPGVISKDDIIDYLDTCVENDGWFISTAHAVVGYDNISRANHDITLQDLTSILDAMKEYSDDGKLWVTDYNTATKYVRERQNSTVAAYELDGNVYVEVTMAEKTADNLPLNTAVFNQPLTVKVAVPEEWSSASYSLGGTNKTVSCFTEGGTKYAYVDVIPNSGEIKVTEAALPTGITYGVWASENDYNAGQMPVYYSTELTLDHTLLGTDGAVENESYKTPGVVPGYVKLYANVGTDPNSLIFIGAEQNLTIDLSGYTLTMGNGFTIGRNSWMEYPNCSLTIKNGNMNIDGGQIIFRAETKGFFENVKFNVTKYTQDSMCYDIGSLLRYTDCEIYLNNERAGWETSASGGKIEFIRTLIKQKYSPTRPLFWVKPGKADLTITFDKNCSITREGNNLLGIASTATENSNIRMLFENGVSFSRNAIPDMTYFSADNYDKEGQYKPATDTIGKIVVTENGFATECSEYYFIKNETNTFTTSNDISDYKIIEWAEGGKIALNVWTEPYLEGSSNSTYKVLLTENNSTIKLYEDITFGQISTFYNYALTFDLNGYTMTSVTSINVQFGCGDLGSINNNLSGQWMPERIIRFTSSSGKGKFVSTGCTWAAFQARPGTSVYFENLDITVNKYMFNDGGANVISFENCTVYSQQEKAIIHSGGIGGGSEQIDRNLIIDNTVLKRTPLAEVYMSFNEKMTYTVRNGSVIDNSIWMVLINGGSPAVNCTRALNIDVDTKFSRDNLAYLISIPEAAANNQKVNINWFDGIEDYTNPGTAIDTAGYNTYAGGKLNIGTLYEDVTYYCFRERPSVAGAITANLTLKTNFNLNFYCDPAVIKAIYLGDEALEAVEWNGLNKYTVPFAAHEAANDLTFRVIANFGAEDYELTLNYSVLAYAEALMATDASQEAKALVKSAMAYVKEAYAYAALTDSNISISERLSKFDTNVETVENTSVPYESLTAAISGVQLKLDSAVKLVLNLNANYSGMLTVNGVNYAVTDGKLADGATSILIELRAKELYNTPVVIIAGNETAEFTLAGYANRAAVAESEAKALVDALYIYTYYANAYANTEN